MSPVHSSVIKRTDHNGHGTLYRGLIDIVMERFLVDFAGNGSVKRSELTQNNRIF